MFYWLGEKQSYLWAVTPQKTSLFPLPSKSEIDAAVQRYRKALVGPQDVLETSNADGIALYRMLIAPAQSLLKKETPVFIIPDGSLNNLNFETLLVPEPTLHYWIEDATIADANSLRLLAASHPRVSSKTAASKLLLLIGDAITPNPEYGELPKAEVEIENIEKHFPPTEPRSSYPSTSHGSGLRKRFSRAFRLYSLRSAWNRQPIEPVGFRRNIVEGLRRGRFIQAICERNHSPPIACAVSDDFNLLWCGGSRLYG